MSKKSILFDINRCMGCNSCQLACKQENDLAPHNIEDALAGNCPTWRKVIEIEQGEYGEEQINYVSLACMHCADAPCVMACPTGALFKDSEDGRVLVDQSKCIGCRMCLQVCPFGIPQYDFNDLMQKCDLCLKKLSEDENALPACVAACPSKALSYGDTNVQSQNMQKKAAAKFILATDKPYATLF